MRPKVLCCPLISVRARKDDHFHVHIALGIMMLGDAPTTFAEESADYEKVNCGMAYWTEALGAGLV